MLRLDEFDDAIFTERINRILVFEPDRLIFIMKDGTKKECVWNPPNIHPKWSLEHRHHFTETYRRKKEARLYGEGNEDSSNGQPIHSGSD